MARTSSFSKEQRARAVRLVAEAVPHHESEYQAIASVAAKIGASTETVRKWVRRAEVDDGTRPGTTTSESEELKKLRRENAELRRANEILKSASAFFAAELDRPGPR
jgi:transposase